MPTVAMASTALRSSPPAAKVFRDLGEPWDRCSAGPGARQRFEGERRMHGLMRRQSEVQGVPEEGHAVVRGPLLQREVGRVQEP